MEEAPQEGETDSQASISEASLSDFAPVSPRDAADHPSDLIAWEVRNLAGSNMGTCTFLRQDTLPMVRWRLFVKMNLQQLGAKTVGDIKVVVGDSTLQDNISMGSLFDKGHTALLVILSSQQS